LPAIKTKSEEDTMADGVMAVASVLAVTVRVLCVPAKIMAVAAKVVVVVMMDNSIAPMFKLKAIYLLYLLCLLYLLHLLYILHQCNKKLE
jgi:hypothetical protein